VVKDAVGIQKSVARPSRTTLVKRNSVKGVVRSVVVDGNNESAGVADDVADRPDGSRDLWRGCKEQGT
jgi:hypothetical protein